MFQLFPKKWSQINSTDYKIRYISLMNSLYITIDKVGRILIFLVGRLFSLHSI